MVDLEKLRTDWLTIPDPRVAADVRRCLEGHLARTLPGPCRACGGATVSRALVRVYTGEDELVALDLARRAEARRIVRALAVAIWVLALLRVLAYLIFDGAITTFFVAVTTAVFALALNVTLVLTARAILDSFRGPPLHGVQVDDLPAKLELLAERVLEPFLARNGVAEGLAVRAPPEELVLLEQAFAREGLVPRHGSLPGLLASAALARDFRRFKERLAATGHEDRHLAYARAVHDERHIPMLEQLLVEDGRDPVDTHELVRAHRSDRKLDNFLEDLEQRRSAPSLNVTIEAVDAIEKASFEELVLMVLGSEGFERRSGFVERHGEKTLVLARQETKPVDAATVQEAVVARARLSCEHALVVTNSTFTDAARELASSNRVELVDRAALTTRLAAFNKAPKDYGRLAAVMTPRSA